MSESPNLNIVLVEPLIPQNTGNIARLAAATNSTLHLVHPLGFEITESRVKRAGLDYWPWVKLVDHESWAAFREWAAEHHPDFPFYFFTKKATRSYADVSYGRGDFLIFGKETTGFSEALFEEAGDRGCRIPIFNENIRSLNLSNAVSIVVYEALRQIGFPGE